VLLSQEERLFHRDERYPHTHDYVPAPSEEVRIQLTDLGNPTNPLSQVQGNDEARKRLCHAAFTALGRYNHVCNDVAFLLTGPKGAPKKDIARRFAELLRLPFIEINSATIRTAHDIFIEISNALKRAKLPLVECKGPGRYVLPPCVVFFADCHDLKQQKPPVWTTLLQAVGSHAPTLRTEQGVHVQTLHATWMLATSERADLMDGLPDRFTELSLTSPGAAPLLDPSDLDQKYQPAPRPDLSSLRAKRAELEKRGILGPPTQAWLKESGDVNQPTPSAEKLKRWQDSSHPHAWVEAHKGAWNHADWLSLVEELKNRSIGRWTLIPLDRYLKNRSKDTRSGSPPQGLLRYRLLPHRNRRNGILHEAARRTVQWRGRNCGNERHPANSSRPTWCGRTEWLPGLPPVQSRTFSHPHLSHHPLLLFPWLLRLPPQ
jgi:hypothetical protein